MGIFDSPGPAVQKDEFYEMLNHSDLHNLPQEDRTRLKDLAAVYFERPGHLPGIRKEDKEEFMKRAKNMVRPMYHNMLPIISHLLDEGIKGTYGRTF